MRIKSEELNYYMEKNKTATFEIQQFKAQNAALIKKLSDATYSDDNATSAASNVHSSAAASLNSVNSRSCASNLNRTKGEFSF